LSALSHSSGANIASSPLIRKKWKASSFCPFPFPWIPRSRRLGPDTGQSLPPFLRSLPLFSPEMRTPFRVLFMARRIPKVPLRQRLRRRSVRTFPSRCLPITLLFFRRDANDMIPLSKMLFFCPSTALDHPVHQYTQHFSAVSLSESRRPSPSLVFPFDISSWSVCPVNPRLCCQFFIRSLRFFSRSCPPLLHRRSLLTI